MPRGVIDVRCDDVVLKMASMAPVTCRCGGTVVVTWMPLLPVVGGILHTQPTCRPYDRLGVRDFYDYLRTGREPAPSARTR